MHEKVQGNGDNVVNDHESYVKLSLGSTERDLKTHKVLGQSFYNETDEINFNLSKTVERAKTLAPTKRNLLSILASLFDPLGIVCPAIVYAKILFQDVCREKIGWDETFTGEILKKWETWCNELIKSSEITTPRCVYQHPIENVLECTLHASKKAYCAVLYFVYRTDTGIYVRLLTSKARVAPLVPQG